MENEKTRFALSRREFLRRSALFATGALLASCAPAVTPTTAPTAPTAGATKAALPPTAIPTTVPTLAPRKGGTLTWALWDKTDVIDPAVPTGASALEIVNNVLDTLVTLDADQKIYPMLAAKWTVEDNAKKFTFTLRDGVKFHDGSALDSSAVKRSWDRILDPKMKAAGVVSLFGPIDKIDAPDAKTVVVTFKDPYPSFLQQIWRPYFGIFSGKFLDTLKPGDQAVTLVGSGPFKFTGRSADGVVTLEANPDYAWGPELLKNRNAPYLQTIKFRSITEPATRVATLESGENLLIDELPEPDYNRLKDDKRFAFVGAPRRGPALGFFINVQKAPTDDKAVREAINWAVDRKSIVEKLFFGVHKVTVGPLAEGVWSRLDELEKTFGFDPKKAQQILDAAGWKVGADKIREKGGQKLSLVLATFRSPWSEIAEAMQSQLRDIGIDLQVNKMERSPYLDFVRSFKHNLCASAGTSIDPDILRTYYHSANKTSDFANLKDPQLEALMDKGAQQALGSDERRKTYEDVQRRLVEVLPYVSVMSQIRVEAEAAKVRDLRMGADGLNALSANDIWLES